MGYQDSGNRSCAFHSGNLNGDNYGNNKTIQKNVERNFTNVFDWKPFKDSGAWRCNQRVSACEFNLIICIYQYGNYAVQNVSQEGVGLYVICHFDDQMRGWKRNHYQILVAYIPEESIMLPGATCFKDEQ